MDVLARVKSRAIPKVNKGISEGNRYWFDDPSPIGTKPISGQLNALKKASDTVVNKTPVVQTVKKSIPDIQTKKDVLPKALPQKGEYRSQLAVMPRGYQYK